MTAQGELQEDLFKANENSKLKWWVHSGSSVYEIFKFWLQGAKRGYRIKYVPSKSFFQRFLSLFKKGKGYYEITVEKQKGEQILWEARKNEILYLEKKYKLCEYCEVYVKKVHWKKHINSIYHKKLKAKLEKK